MKHKLFAIIIVLLMSISTANAQFWKTRDFSLSMNFEVECGAGASNFRMLALIPCTHEGVQAIHKTKFSHEPTNIYMEGNNCFAEFYIEHPQSNFTITAEIEGTLYNNDYLSAKSKKRLSAAELAPYLEHTDMCEVNSPEIQNAAKNFKKFADTPIELVHLIWSEIHAIPFYDDPNAKAKSAVTLLKEGKGNCLAKTHLFIAVCRACGIPAREYGGLAPTTGHGWPEVYLNGKGWVKFEPTHLQECHYQMIKGLHIRLYDRDFVFKGMHTYSQWHAWWNGTVKVRDNHRIRITRTE